MNGTWQQQGGDNSSAIRFAVVCTEREDDYGIKGSTDKWTKVDWATDNMDEGHDKACKIWILWQKIKNRFLYFFLLS